MKNIYVTLILFIFVNHSFGQTTATDFTAIDCHDNSYNLFNQLNAGKVVVLAWVMPCSSCIADPLESFTIIQGYSMNDQNRIQFNLVDDLGNTSCESLSGWAGLYGMGDANMISDPVVSMSDYGVDGMPKIVIIAGANHKIYFNENSSVAGFQEAMDLALAENPLSTNELSKVDYKISVFPNPANNYLKVEYSLNELSNLSIEIVDLLGNTVVDLIKKAKKETGNYIETIYVNGLKNGVYFLRIITAKGTQIKKFVIAR